MTNRLHWLASLGTAEEVEEEMKQEKFDVNTPDGWGRTPYLRAAYAGQVSILKILEEYGADVKMTDDYKRSALHLAAKQNCDDAVHYLLEMGADVMAQDDWFRQPVHLAALKGAMKTLKIIFNNSKVSQELHASIDDHERTPLHLAAKDNKSDALQYLLEMGADVTAPDNRGRQPHHLAAMHGAADTLNILLANEEVDIDACDNWNNTALDLAVYNGQQEIVKLLKQMKKTMELLE